MAWKVDDEVNCKIEKIVSCQGSIQNIKKNGKNVNMCIVCGFHSRSYRTYVLYTSVNIFNVQMTTGNWLCIREYRGYMPALMYTVDSASIQKDLPMTVPPVTSKASYQ